VLVALVTATTFLVPFRLRLFFPQGAIHHELDPLVSYQRDVSGLRVAANGGVVVTIRAGRPGRVTVSTSLAWLFGKPTITQSWQGGALLVGATCPRLDALGYCQANVTIAVPAGTPVQAQAGPGSVAVAGLSGPLHLSATSGTLTVTDISGPLWATVTSGSVVARGGVRSPQVQASAATGLITLAFAARPRHLGLGIGAGDAVITLPPGSRYRIVGSHGPGALLVAPGLSDARSDLVLDATIGLGVATIGYPGQRH
jgi:hypothetical protein